MRICIAGLEGSAEQRGEIETISLQVLLNNNNHLLIEINKKCEYNGYTVETMSSFGI